jgi:Putative inner membrane protein (DUF1819)
MTDRPKYTTQLQAGLGLVPETVKLLAVWKAGMNGQDLFKVALASGEFPAVTARRLQNVVTEAFRPRYLIEGAAPAKLLKKISNSLPRDDFRSLCFLFTCRANRILADFVRQVYWPRYSAGGTSVSKADTLQFVSLSVSDGRATRPWSATTVTRVASYLLGTCADFGLLGVMKAGSRPILNFRITPDVVAILAHDLHFQGLGDNVLMQHPDWGLFGLEVSDVLGEMKRLSLRGELIVQAAGGITQVSWKYKSMEELADGIAKG